MHPLYFFGRRACDIYCYNLWRSRRRFWIFKIRMSDLSRAISVGSFKNRSVKAIHCGYGHAAVRVIFGLKFTAVTLFSLWILTIIIRWQYYLRTFKLQRNRNEDRPLNCVVLTVSKRKFLFLIFVKCGILVLTWVRLTTR